MGRWSKNEIKFIETQVEKGIHPQDFIDEFNVKFKTNKSLSAIEKKLHRLNITYGNVAVNTISSELKIAELQTQVKTLKRKYQTVLKQSNVQDTLLDTIRDTVEAIPEAPVPKMIIPKGDITHESVLLLLSDLHIGEIVNKEETNGINEYNVDIFRYRMKFLEQHIIDIVKNKLIGYSFDKLVIAGLGDWVSGLIHQELIETADGNVIEWVLGGALVVAQFMRNLAQVFPKIEFVGVVGNHGRLHKKPRFKQRYINWDYLIYQTVSLMLTNQKNITFKLPKSFWTLHEILGHSFLFFHGDNINSYASIPWYGIERTVSKLKELLESQNQKFDYICMGHFHTRNILDRVKGELIVNGSVIGGNEYSIGKLFTSSLASQHLTGIYGKYGTSWNYKIKVQHAPLTGPVPYAYFVDNAVSDVVKDIIK